MDMGILFIIVFNLFEFCVHSCFGTETVLDFFAHIHQSELNHLILSPLAILVTSVAFIPSHFYQSISIRRKVCIRSVG